MAGEARGVGVERSVARDRADTARSVDPARLLAGLPGPWMMANAVRNYDWGSISALAALQGRAPSGQPEAELWMGAHPAAPSHLIQPGGAAVSLLTAVEADPLRVLGPGCVDRFGARLPFLLKVLAVNRALSIQVHPSPVQAAAGFAREQAAGVPAGRRSYVDPFAKPEMLVSVSTFVGLAGLRHHGQVVRMLERLDVPALRPILDALRLQAGPAGSAGALAILATWPQAQRSPLAAAICRRADLLLGERPASFERDERASLEWVLRLADQHHDDPLIVAPLILRLHQLAPGEAMYLPAGVAHSYLSGVGIEVMAASDNVVRGGLTTKRIDGQALIEILDPDAQPLLNLAPAAVGATETRWQPPVPEFALSKVVVNGPPVTLAREHGDLPGPEVLLCLRGDVTVSSPACAVRLRGGTAAFLAAGTAPAVIAGVGEVFRATVGSMSASTR